MHSFFFGQKINWISECVLYARISKKRYECNWTLDTIPHYTETLINVKEQLVVRNDMDVNEHETSHWDTN